MYFLPLRFSSGFPEEFWMEIHAGMVKMVHFRFLNFRTIDLPLKFRFRVFVVFQRERTQFEDTCSKESHVELLAVTF